MSKIDEPIHLVGVGTLNSRSARYLAERGKGALRELHAWDGRKVSLENVGPQTYQERHIGTFKVDALAQQLKEWAGIDLISHAEYIDGPRDLSGVVIVGVDKMSERWVLWEQSIRRNKKVSLMIEARLETAGALIHVVDPNNERHIKKWEQYWYPNESATTFGMSCGAATSRFPIGGLVANLCVTQLLRAQEIKGTEEGMDNQIRITLVPIEVKTFQW